MSNLMNYFGFKCYCTFMVQGKRYRTIDQWIMFEGFLVNNVDSFSPKPFTFYLEPYVTILRLNTLHPIPFTRNHEPCTLHMIILIHYPAV